MYHRQSYNFFCATRDKKAPFCLFEKKTPQYFLEAQLLRRPKPVKCVSDTLNQFRCLIIQQSNQIIKELNVVIILTTQKNISKVALCMPSPLTAQSTDHSTTHLPRMIHDSTFLFFFLSRSILSLHSTRRNKPCK